MGFRVGGVRLADWFSVYVEDVLPGKIWEFILLKLKQCAEMLERCFHEISSL